VCIISPQYHLSTLLITTNILFILFTGPLNICLIIQSISEYFFKISLSKEIFRCFDEYLRLLQNSYHALSFIFYCVIGNKFRSSAKSICRTIYYKFIKFGITDRCAKASLVSWCLVRRRSSSSGQTISTNSRLTGEQRPANSLPLNIIKRPIYVTYDINQRSTKYSATLVCKCEQ